MSATFSEIFPPGTPSVMVKRETVSEDEEIEVGKESDMEEMEAKIEDLERLVDYIDYQNPSFL